MSEPSESPVPEISTVRPERRGLTATLVVVATVLAVVAAFAIWIQRQVLETDTWTETSTELLEDSHVRTAVSGFLVDELYANVDVQGLIGSALPENVRPLAGPAAGALRDLLERGVDEALQRPRAQELWASANRRAHERFVQVVDGGGEVVSTEGGVVTLDLGTLLVNSSKRVGVGGKVADKIPDGAGEIEIMRSSELGLVQDVARSLRPIALLLAGLSLALFALAVFLAGRRREALRTVGFAFAAAGAIVLIGRALLGGIVVDQLADTAASQPTVEAVWRIATSGLAGIGGAMILYGLVVVAGAWLAGPTGVAVAARRHIAPWLADPRTAYGSLVVVVLLLLWWGPTEATRRLLPALLLIVLMAAGLEALRRQTARELPQAALPDIGAGLTDAVGGAAARARKLAAGSPLRARSEANRLERLERLMKLRDGGVLDQDEFEAEKRRLLGSDSDPTAPPDAS